MPNLRRHDWHRAGSIVRCATKRNRIKANAFAYLAAICLAGCSVSVPLGSLVPGHSEDTATSTISNEEISGILVGEDWHSAKPALVAALDPQGSGTPVHWSNPASGAKGFFAADGKAYPSEAGICRAFVADVDRVKLDSASLRGTACADKSGEWTITDIKQSKKS